jgi:hypothetical protein
MKTPIIGGMISRAAVAAIDSVEPATLDHNGESVVVFKLRFLGASHTLSVSVPDALKCHHMLRNALTALADH